MAKRLPEKGTPEWHKIQIAKKTLAINPEMATALGGMTIEEAKKVIEEYGIKMKMDRGGTVVGESHKNGGVPFVLSDTGTAIEEEGKEINIPRELAESDEIYEFEGTNWEILNKILKLGGLSLKSEVTEVKSGDIVICIKSAWDDTPRKYKGTIRQVLSAINESRGCNHIESGATMKNLETGERKKMGKGGRAKSDNWFYRTDLDKYLYGDVESTKFGDERDESDEAYLELFPQDLLDVIESSMAIVDTDMARIEASNILKGLKQEGYEIVKKTAKSKMSRGGDTANKTSGISWIITGTSI